MADLHALERRSWLGLTRHGWGHALFWTSAVVTIMDIAYGLTSHALSAWINPDAEFRPWRGTFEIPALVSFTFLFVAGFAWLRASRGLRGLSQASTVVLGCFFICLGLDDFAGLHERIERWTGIDWKQIYLPVFALAGIVGVDTVVMLRRRYPRAVGWLVLGASLWALAQIFEFFEGFNGRVVSYYDWLMIPEEVFECVGAAMWVFAAVTMILPTSSSQECRRTTTTPSRTTRASERVDS